MSLFSNEREKGIPQSVQECYREESRLVNTLWFNSDLFNILGTILFFVIIGFGTLSLFITAVKIENLGMFIFGSIPIAISAFTTKGVFTLISILFASLAKITHNSDINTNFNIYKYYRNNPNEMPKPVAPQQVVSNQPKTEDAQDSFIGQPIRTKDGDVLYVVSKGESHSGVCEYCKNHTQISKCRFTNGREYFEWRVCDSCYKNICQKYRV